MCPEITFIEAKPQVVWGRPAVTNFVLGSTGCAFYLISSVGAAGAAGQVSRPDNAILLGPVLVAIGFFALTFEAGRPLRAFRVVGNPAGSWMSREAVCAAAFIPCAIFAEVFSSTFLSGLAALAAFMFIISQGMILYSARAMPAWNTLPVPVQFFTSALAAGGGLWIATLLWGAPTAPDRAATAVLLCCAVLDTVAWAGGHLTGRKTSREATRAHLPRDSMSVTTGLLHLLPTIVLVAIVSGAAGIAAKGLMIVAVGAILWRGIMNKIRLLRSAVLSKGIDLSCEWDFDAQRRSEPGRKAAEG